MKVHKVRHYLDRRGTCFEIKIAYTLLNYRELAVLKPAKARTEDVPTKIAIASYRESPNVQVIATTAQTHLPQPGAYRYFARDQKYMRQSMLSLMVKLILSPKNSTLIKKCCRRFDFINGPTLFDLARLDETASKL